MYPGRTFHRYQYSFGQLLIQKGYPLFPGENELDQLSCIMEVLGVPPDDILTAATRRKFYFSKIFSSVISLSAASGKPRIIENSQGIKREPGTKTFYDLLHGIDPLFLSFLESCLKWSAKDRLTPSQLLQHAWIAQLDD